MNLTQEDLEAWRVNPVTEYLLGISERQTQAIKADILADAWESGRVDRDRLVQCQSAEQIVNDYLTASSEDFIMMEGRLDGK